MSDFQGANALTFAMRNYLRQIGGENQQKTWLVALPIFPRSAEATSRNDERFTRGTDLWKIRVNENAV